MRFVALLLVAMSGCGRVAFDPPGRDAMKDAAVDGITDTDSALASLLEGCELRLEMEEMAWSGPDSVGDSCGAHKGTPSGTAHPVDDPVRGRVGAFEGDPSCVQFPDAPELRGGSAFTVSAWVATTALAPNSFGIISKRSSYNDRTAFSVFLWDTANSTNRLWADVDTENERYELTSTSFDATWRQVTVVFDGSQPANQRVAIYVDGSLQAFAPETSTSIPVPGSPPDLAVGCLPLGGPAQSLVGMLDEVVMWSRPLDAASALTWYETTRR